MAKIILSKLVFRIVDVVKKLARALMANVVFLILMLLYFFRSLVLSLKKLHLKTDKFADKLEDFIYKVDGKKEGDVSRVYLIELAIRNLKAKKTRAFVTIGGVALGVGAIVFLVSLGYGVEKLVVGRVTRLEELKMADVAMGGMTISRINDEMIEKIKSLDGVGEVIPMVSMVSKVRFNNSVLDIMALGVDERYIKAVGAKIIAGKEMKTKDGEYNLGSINVGQGTVAGASQQVVVAKFGESKDNKTKVFNIGPESKVPLWENCQIDNKGEMKGYLMRTEGGFLGEEVWGEKYFGADDLVVGKDETTGKELSLWVKTEGQLWKEVEEGKMEPVLGVSGRQEWAKGCVKENEVGWDVDGLVLGISDEASGSAVAGQGETLPDALFETVISTDSAGVEWVELKQVETVTDEKKTLSFFGVPEGEAFISLGMLKVLGMDREGAIGKKFLVQYIVPDGLIPESQGKSLSDEVEYTVAGVVDDESTNYYYFRLSDALRLGVKNYSQLKVIAKEQNVLGAVRKNIETMGMKTASTVDTVAEIEKLFGTIRMVLGLLGTIALAVAALGMFNTMTVSLLERTREVGVMKAMGMLSEDVRELFLAESMIMGVGGGLFGVLFGLLMGKTISLVLTSISMFKGQGAMDISYVPFFFIAFIMLVSFVVGVLTGWYPSKRARSISALNALRYE